jgi:hypothetical protein
MKKKTQKKKKEKNHLAAEAGRRSQHRNPASAHSRIEASPAQDIVSVLIGEEKHLRSPLRA